MKTSRLVITIILVVVMGIAWFTLASSNLTDSTNINRYVSEGDQYLDKKLYQRAIESYQEVIKISPRKDIYEKINLAAQGGYEDSVITLSEAEELMIESCNKYPKEVLFWENTISFCYDAGDYKKAYNHLKKAKKYGVKSEKIDELYQNISYEYVFKSRVYTQYLRSPEGYYTVSSGEYWNVLNRTGDLCFGQDYTYASPIGYDRKVVLATEKDARIYDKNRIVLAYLPDEIQEAKAIEGDYVPVKTSSGWTFYMYERELFFDEMYEDVSSFVDGVAAVKKSGKWVLINQENQEISEREFDSIKFHGNGDYSYNDIMVASENGKYNIYSSNGEILNNIQCEDLDIYLGESIAFKDENGKWGYINEKGNVTIEPQYDEAKSFSNNMAAVKKDNKWGFIDAEGKVVIDYQFLDADYFTDDGMVMVSKTEGQFFSLNLRFPEVLDY